MADSCLGRLQAGSELRGLGVEGVLDAPEAGVGKGLQRTVVNHPQVRERQKGNDGPVAVKSRGGGVETVSEPVPLKERTDECPREDGDLHQSIEEVG